MLAVIGSRLVILLFGTLYPAYASYKAVRNKDVKAYVQWMMYWIVFALFTCAETFSDVFLSFLVPFYYELKIVFVVWLLLPATNGSSLLYRKFVHPMLTEREKEIDEYLAKMKERSCSTVLELGTKGINYALQTAIKGGGGLVNQLRKSYSLSDLSNDHVDGAAGDMPPRRRALPASQQPQHMDISEDEDEIPLGGSHRGYAPRRSASGTDRVEMYFPAVDVEVRQRGGGSGHAPRPGNPGKSVAALRSDSCDAADSGLEVEGEPLVRTASLSGTRTSSRTRRPVSMAGGATSPGTRSKTVATSSVTEEAVVDSSASFPPLVPSLPDLVDPESDSEEFSLSLTSSEQLTAVEVGQPGQGSALTEEIGESEVTDPAAAAKVIDPGELKVAVIKHADMTVAAEEVGKLNTPEVREIQPEFVEVEEEEEEAPWDVQVSEEQTETAVTCENLPTQREERTDSTGRESERPEEEENTGDDAGFKTPEALEKEDTGNAGFTTPEALDKEDTGFTTPENLDKEDTGFKTPEALDKEEAGFKTPENLEKENAGFKFPEALEKEDAGFRTPEEGSKESPGSRRSSQGVLVTVAVSTPLSEADRRMGSMVVRLSMESLPTSSQAAEDAVIPLVVETFDLARTSSSDSLSASCSLPGTPSVSRSSSRLSEGLGEGRAGKYNKRPAPPRPDSPPTESEEAAAVKARLVLKPGMVRSLPEPQGGEVFLAPPRAKKQQPKKKSGGGGLASLFPFWQSKPQEPASKERTPTKANMTNL